MSSWQVFRSPFRQAWRKTEKSSDWSRGFSSRRMPSLISWCSSLSFASSSCFLNTEAIVRFKATRKAGPCNPADQWNRVYHHAARRKGNDREKGSSELKWRSYVRLMILSPSKAVVGLRLRHRMSLVCIPVQSARPAGSKEVDPEPCHFSATCSRFATVAPSTALPEVSIFAFPLTCICSIACWLARTVVQKPRLRFIHHTDSLRP